MKSTSKLEYKEMLYMYNTNYAFINAADLNSINMIAFSLILKNSKIREI